MKFLKEIFDFYINSSLHIALAAFSLVKVTLLPLGIYENTTPLFVFFSTMFAYNFIKFYQVQRRVPFVIRPEFRRFPVYLLNLIALGMVLWLGWQLKAATLPVLIPLLIITLFYAVPFRVGKKNLRNVAGLKLFLIALVWAGTTVLLPLIQNGVSLERTAGICFLQRLVLIFAVTIPFDIRDLGSDHEHLKTLPQMFGIQQSKIIGAVLLLIFFLLSFVKGNAFPGERIVEGGIALIGFLFLWFSNKEQSRYYTAFWIDAIPVFWFLWLLLVLG